MTIVCLGWGSLIWNPGNLPCSSEWKTDGPVLPIEFARISNGGRVTLVLTPAAKDVPVLHASLNVNSLEDAVSALAIREGVIDHDSIGRWPSQKSYPFSNVIESWARARDVTGIVWTALPPGTKENRGQIPSLDDVVRYLKTLDDQQKAAAIEYVRKAPAQIATGYRPSIEHELGIVPAICVADLGDAPADSREPGSN
ncbi:MAG: hypothetical protein KDK08_29550, partial [Rhizobiaceae bacterium]|nr:hypothetical protein [Rhizobiaceae bacterium]